jgi:hypothetical protein
MYSRKQIKVINSNEPWIPAAVDASRDQIECHG